jgi:F-type H+-transporting ATPase subunit delta
MNSGMISTRYARALFEYALEKGEEDIVFSEIKNLSATFYKEYALRTALDNPVLLVTDKINVIKAAAGEKISDVLNQFIELVLYKKRESYLYSICLVFMDLYRDYKKISIGRLITAKPIDKDTENKIKQLVKPTQGGTLEFETETNPDILGGFILYMDTYRLDASVSTQLRNIRRQLLDKNKKIV